MKKASIMRLATFLFSILLFTWPLQALADMAFSSTKPFLYTLIEQYFPRQDLEPLLEISNAMEAYSCSGSYVCPDDPEPLCGNGIVEDAEECDDANPANTDGCSSDCEIEFGYQCIESVCSFGDCYDLDASWCSPTCGDSIVVGTETCDDGNDEPGDGCDECTTEDGYICLTEEYSQYEMTTACVSGCGNGEWDWRSEECDDGNFDDEDGCSRTCQVEAGWNCNDQILGCQPVCGDGFVSSGETCDDGNREVGDGCGYFCQVEPGWSLECTIVLNK